MGGIFDIVSKEGATTWDVVEYPNEGPIASIEGIILSGTAHAKGHTPLAPMLKGHPLKATVEARGSIGVTTLDDGVDLVALVSAKSSIFGDLRHHSRILSGEAIGRGNAVSDMFFGPSIYGTCNALGKASDADLTDRESLGVNTAEAKAHAESSLRLTLPVSGSCKSVSNTNAVFSLEIPMTSSCHGRSNANGYAKLQERLTNTVKVLGSGQGYLVEFVDYETGDAKSKAASSGSVDLEDVTGFSGDAMSRSKASPANLVTLIKLESASASAKSGSVATLDWFFDLHQTIRCVGLSYATELDMTIYLPSSSKAKANVESSITILHQEYLSSSAIAKANASAPLYYLEGFVSTIIAKSLADGEDLKINVQLYASSEVKSTGQATTIDLTESLEGVSVPLGSSSAGPLDLLDYIAGESKAFSNIQSHLNYKAYLSGLCIEKARSETHWGEHVQGSAWARGNIVADLTNNIRWFYSTAKSWAYTGKSALDFRIELNATAIAQGNITASLAHIEDIEATAYAKSSATAIISYKEELGLATAEAKGLSEGHVTPHILMVSTAAAKGNVLGDADARIQIFGTGLAKANVSGYIQITVQGLSGSASALGKEQSSLRDYQPLRSVAKALGNGSVGGFGYSLSAKATSSSQTAANLGTSDLVNLGRLWFEIYE